MSETIRILYAEDDFEFANLTEIYLRREDDRFLIEHALNPDDALDLSVENKYDCIISDYDMPGMNGIEFLKKVRDHNSYVPFILFTGKGSEELASEAISNGVTDYLQKGSSSDVYSLLANRIRNAVDQYQSQQILRRFRKAVDAAGHAIYMTDSDGTITYVNPVFERITGFEQEDVLGRTPRLLKSGEMSDDYYDNLWKTIQRGDIWKEEIINQRRSGELYRAVQTIAPVIDDDGTIEAYVAIQADITKHTGLSE